MSDLDVCAFIERAAIIEFCGGVSRFRAETLAAEAQGFTRWQALKEVSLAERNGHLEPVGDHRPQMAWEQRPNDLPGVQRGAEEKDGPVSERNQNTGRDSLDVLALRHDGRGVL